MSVILHQERAYKMISLLGHTCCICFFSIDLTGLQVTLQWEEIFVVAESLALQNIHAC
jgi:hypothetical protein